MVEKVPEEVEYQRNAEYVGHAVTTGNIAALVGNVANTLFRLMQAQEKLVMLMQLDLEEQLQAEAQSRAEALAEEMVQDKTKRSFIGKR